MISIVKVDCKLLPVFKVVHVKRSHWAKKSKIQTKLATTQNGSQLYLYSMI